MVKVKKNLRNILTNQRNFVLMAFMKQILLPRGQFTLVDDDDFEYLSAHKWHIHYITPPYLYAYTNIRLRPYIKGRAKYKTVSMARMIMAIELIEQSEDMVVDHWNHNTLDNQRRNLRVCTQSENCLNRAEQTNSLNWLSVHVAKLGWKYSFMSQKCRNKEFPCFLLEKWL